MIKIYTYSDESGQDTKGQYFIVCTVIITDSNKDKVEKELLEIEKISHKTNKWNKTSTKYRQKYIETLINKKIFSFLSIYYSEFTNKKDYIDLIASHIAKSVINYTDSKNYTAIIFYDKTNKSEIQQLRKEINKYKIKYKKIRNLSDKSSSLIRLADATCGLIRDLDNKKHPEIYEKIGKKIIKI